MICQVLARRFTARNRAALPACLALLLFGPAAARAASIEVDAGVTGGSCCVYKTIAAVPGQGTNMTTVNVGDTVHWVWKTNAHSITSDTGAWTDSGVKNTGFTFDITFNTPGTFRYHCSIHGSAGSGMAGTITVTAPLPLAPANLTATAGDSQVSLTWNASAGATGYKVKRSTTSGGPYTTLNANVPGTTYTDLTATDGTTYFYVVTAANSAGESGSSNEAAATPTGQTVTGRIGLDSVPDLSATAATAPLGLFTLDFRSPGTTTLLATRSISLTPTGAGSPFGAFTVTNIPNGTYDIAAKGTKSLRVLKSGVVINGPAALPDITLPGGDSDNNNLIDIADFGALVNAYGGDAGVPASGYIPAADFNYDGKIDIADFGILVNNYSNGGAP